MRETKRQKDRVQEKRLLVTFDTSVESRPKTGDTATREFKTGTTMSIG